MAGSFLVDKAEGKVYRSLEDTTIIGTYSKAFGLRLDGETAEVAQRLNNDTPMGGMAPQFEGGESLSFVNPLIELDTQIRPRTSIKVVDEPGGQAKSGYQGTNPDWLDSQHATLTVEPWFYDKGTLTPHGGVKKLAKGAQGQFLVGRSFFVPSNLPAAGWVIGLPCLCLLRLPMHMYSYTHLHTHTHTHRHTHMHTQTHTHAPMHPCTHAPMHPRTHAPMHPCTHAPMHPCTHQPAVGVATLLTFGIGVPVLCVLQVRVVHGKELYAIPSTHHNGQPGKSECRSLFPACLVWCLVLPEKSE